MVSNKTAMLKMPFKTVSRISNFCQEILKKEQYIQNIFSFVYKWYICYWELHNICTRQEMPTEMVK